jgi:hypothetical protein
VSGGFSLAKSDLTNITNADFLIKAEEAGVGGAGITTVFNTIAVAGQSSVVADTHADTLTLVAGTDISITTNSATDTITINNSYVMPTASTSTLGGVRVDGSTIGINNGVISSILPAVSFTFSVSADDSTLRIISSEESIKFIGAGSVTTTSDADGNITITGTSASTSFATLTDAVSAAATIDMIYLPAITRLTVTANGASAYRFDQYGTSDNPTLYVISGTTIAFNLSSLSSHPFLIQDNTLTNITTGLVHVTTAGVVTTGASAQGKTSGTLYWKIPAALSAVTYAYQCSSHGPMVGSITIKGIASI